MLDPITALAIAGNVAQFIDLGLKATSKFREIHESVTGATDENVDLELMTKSLVAINAQLYTSTGSTSETEPLEELCQHCAKIADTLISALESFKVQGKKTRWKSARKALKTLWGREAVEEMRNRLLEFRSDFQLQCLVRIKGNLDLLALEQSSRFNQLDDNGKATLMELTLSRETLTRSLQEQEAANQTRHDQSAKAAHELLAKSFQELEVANQCRDAELRLSMQSSQESLARTLGEQQETRDERLQAEMKQYLDDQLAEMRTAIVAAVNGAAATTDTQFQLTRKEIELVGNTVTRHEQDISQTLEEVNTLAHSLARASTEKQRKRLQERRDIATQTLYSLISAYKALTSLLENLKVQAAALMASIGFAQLWRAQEEASTQFSFQREGSSTIVGTTRIQENEEVRQRRTAVLCSNYYYYYFPLCRRRHIVQKKRIITDLSSICPVDVDIEAQFPNLPLLLTLTQAEWQPNFSWAIKDAVELPFLFNLPTPSVAYDFLSVAIAFSAVMPQITDEIYGENILADMFGNSTYLSSPPGSAQRQRIKNDYRDWQKIAGLLWLDELFVTCHEESCQLWQAEPSNIRLVEQKSNPEFEPLLVRFWLWLIGGWKSTFQFEVPYNPHFRTRQSVTRNTGDQDFILVYSTAKFLALSSYHVSLSIEEDSTSRKSIGKVSFIGAQAVLSVPAPAIVQQRIGLQGFEAPRR
ncbi:hypothetical protein BJ875DRAFT_509629 [Amylocarpus encephaloides]|uniref:Fungal N-terminal domain-containing protein n=1 Tax=Amylocarpus encephaloides TaxID=45428 RepID=A0A9P8C587_9HELO|nr:hypothetical protein BJ875DRAFT_509629 [Amylocarpus encephaloides]